MMHDADQVGIYCWLFFLSK